MVPGRKHNYSNLTDNITSSDSCKRLFWCKLWGLNSSFFPHLSVTRLWSFINTTKVLWHISFSQYVTIIMHYHKSSTLRCGVNKASTHVNEQWEELRGENMAESSTYREIASIFCNTATFICTDTLITIKNHSFWTLTGLYTVTDGAICLTKTVHTGWWASRPTDIVLKAIFTQKSC